MVEFSQIGWFDPGSRRFCYTDEKEHRPDLKTGYTHPVFSIDSVTASRLSVQLESVPTDAQQPNAEIAWVKEAFACAKRGCNEDYKMMWQTRMDAVLAQLQH